MTENQQLPHKTKKKSFSLKTMILVIIVLAVVPIIFLLILHLFAKTSANNMPIPTIKITASQLYQMYSQNEVAANQNLNGNNIEITGTVSSIDETVANSMIVALDDGSNSLGVFNTRLSMYNNQQNLVAILNKGDEITAICKTSQRILNAPSLDGCYFVRTPLYKDSKAIIIADGQNIQPEGATVNFNIEIFFTNQSGYLVIVQSSVNCRTGELDLNNVLYKKYSSGFSGKDVAYNESILNQNNPGQNKVLNSMHIVTTKLTNKLSKNPTRDNLATFIENICPVQT